MSANPPSAINASLSRNYQWKGFIHVPFAGSTWYIRLFTCSIGYHSAGAISTKRTRMGELHCLVQGIDKVGEMSVVSWVTKSSRSGQVVAQKHYMPQAIISQKVGWLSSAVVQFESLQSFE
jgi:hypothetical protein